jgi:hypothetical protein
MAQLHRPLLLIFQLIAILCALFRSINLKNVTFPWFIVIVSSFKCPRRGRSFFFRIWKSRKTLLPTPCRETLRSAVNAARFMCHGRTEQI